MQVRRRHFLKMTAVGATGLALGRARPAFAAWPASGTLDINPDISNLRVVACVDTAMMKSKPTGTTFAAENAVMDSARVQADMDAMAMQLANASSADAAWKTIFRSSKPWASTIVAIKVNVTEPQNMPRVAVIEKICRVFASLGVPASNVIVYDGGPSSFASNTSNYTSYFSTTDTSKIPGTISHLNDGLGGTTNAALPNGSSATCTADIAKGKVDILVSIAVNKGHPNFGGATLCMKNHFGTFLANHTDLNNYIFNINKSDAIVGGTPVRQQLCIVDSIIANKASNTGPPEAMPCYLVMGTFAPAVDYLTVKKLREAVMSATHDSTVIDSYMTTFGYTTKDPQWILVPPAAATADAGAGGAGGSAGTSGAGGTKGSGGTGGTSSSAGTGGAGGGGTQATGGARTTSSGGTQASGGTGSGGAPGSGGAQTTSSGGTRGAGGMSGSGGASMTSSGGTQGMGGGDSGGASGRGGSAGGGEGGSGGVLTSSASATGNTKASGGASGGGAAASVSGCNCRVGSARDRLAGMGVSLAVAALITGQLRRLCMRRATLTETQPAKKTELADAAKSEEANRHGPR